MKSIFLVLCDCGDGSQRIEYHKEMSQDIIDEIEKLDRYGTYASGDGFQCTELKFPDEFDLDNWAFFNGINWFDMSEYKADHDPVSED